MPSILIADDDPDLREILTTVFTGAGMDVIIAADGATAMQLAMQSVPDVVFADFDMPGLTGVQLCHAMREHEQLRSVPLAILTGYLVAGDSRIRELSCCTVMFEPCSNKELLAVTRNLIERGNHDHDPQGQCLSSDDITALAAQATRPSYLAFSPPYVDLNTLWPPADGSTDDPPRRRCCYPARTPTIREFPAALRTGRLPPGPPARPPRRHPGLGETVTTLPTTHRHHRNPRRHRRRPTPRPRLRRTRWPPHHPPLRPRPPPTRRPRRLPARRALQRGPDPRRELTAHLRRTTVGVSPASEVASSGPY